MNPGGGLTPDAVTHPGHNPTLARLSVTGVPPALGVAAVLGVTTILRMAGLLNAVWERSPSSLITAVSGVTGVAPLREELLAAVVSGVKGVTALGKELLSTLVLGAAEVAVSPDGTSEAKYLARGLLSSDTSRVDA